MKGGLDFKDSNYFFIENTTFSNNILQCNDFKLNNKNLILSRSSFLDFLFE